MHAEHLFAHQTDLVELSKTQFFISFDIYVCIFVSKEIAEKKKFMSRVIIS